MSSLLDDKFSEKLMPLQNFSYLEIFDVLKILNPANLIGLEKLLKILKVKLKICRNDEGSDFFFTRFKMIKRLTQLG